MDQNSRLATNNIEEETGQAEKEVDGQHHPTRVRQEENGELIERATSHWMSST